MAMKPKNKSRAVARKAFKSAKSSGKTTKQAAASAGKAAQRVRSGKSKGRGY